MCDNSGLGEFPATLTTVPWRTKSCAPLCAARRLAARAVPPP